MPQPILQAFIRGSELLVESHVLDEFGQPGRVLQRRAPVSAELRAALDAQLIDLDAEQAAVEAQARAAVASGKRISEHPAADLIAKASRRVQPATNAANQEPTP